MNELHNCVTVTGRWDLLTTSFIRCGKRGQTWSTPTPRISSTRWKTTATGTSAWGSFLQHNCITTWQMKSDAVSLLTALNHLRVRRWRSWKHRHWSSRVHLPAIKWFPINQWICIEYRRGQGGCRVWGDERRFAGSDSHRHGKGKWQ